MKTYQEMINMGYKNADQKYQRGYVSRNSDIRIAKVHTAGGSRAGEKYILIPCYHSTQYCIRQYLSEPN